MELSSIALGTIHCINDLRDLIQWLEWIKDQSSVNELSGWVTKWVIDEWSWFCVNMMYKLDKYLMNWVYLNLKCNSMKI